jgi:hypothetical protein
MSDNGSVREQLKKRLRESQERGEFSGGASLFKSSEEVKGRIWKCGEGKHIIDILPYRAGKFDPSAKEGEMQYVYEFFVHDGLGTEGKGQVMCLDKTYGKPCPICEDYKKKKKEGEEADILKALLPKRNPKSIYNILCWDKGEDKKGVQLFIISHYYIGKYLLELASTPIREGQENIEPVIPFMDAEEGKSVYFRREGEAKETRFYGHQLLDRPKGFEISKADLKDCFCIDEIIKIPTYKEVEALYLGSSKKDDNEDEDRPSRSSRRNRDDDEDRSSRSSRGKMEEDQDNKCDFGHKFGIDANKYPDDCEECDLWKDCVRQARKEKDKKQEQQDEKPAPRRSRAEEDEPEEKATRTRTEESDEEPTARRRRR